MPPGGFGGSSWGGGPWGGSLTVIDHQATVFDVLLTDSVAVEDLAFVGTIIIPHPVVGADSPTKVQVNFRVPMSLSGAFTNPSNYIITEVEGGISVPVLSITISGPAPHSVAVLELGSSLSSKDYYSLEINPSIVSVTGHSSVPDIVIFQWADMTRPLFGVPLEISIEDFSGEVSGGILGNPDGLVFFTPAYDTVGGTSTIEVEDVSVCTTAYDEYHLPRPLDPIPLMTFGGSVPSLIGSSSVLWAPADRLGQARLDLEVDHSELFVPAYDSPAYAELVETIDISKASFLNDTRWKTFPATSALQFKTASNLSPIGPGPTSLRTLDWPKIVLFDPIPVTDMVIINIQDVELDTDDVAIVGGLIVQNITVGFIAITIDEAISISDTLVPGTDYRRTLPLEAITVSDTVQRDKTLSATLLDTVSVTDSVVIVAGVTLNISVSDTATITDTTALSWDYGRSASETVAVTDVSLTGFDYSPNLNDAFSVTDGTTFDFGYGRSGNDTAILTDSVSLIKYSVYVVSVSDTLNITDAITNQVDKTLGDTFTATDSNTTNFEYGRSPSDTAVITETVDEEILNGSINVAVSDTVAFEEVIWTGAAVQGHDTTYSPVGLWQLNDTLNDTSGNSFNLTLDNGTVAYSEISPGMRGLALDGSTSVQYAVSTATLGRTGDITLECLLNLTSYSNGRFLISYAGSSSSSTGNALYSIELMRSAALEFTWDQETGTNVASRTSAFANLPPLNQICHLAMTRISNVIQVYLNGVLTDTSSTLTTPTGGGSSVFRIGTHSSRGAAPQAVVSSVKVVASGLTAAQIASEYNRTLGRLYGEI